MKPRDFFFMPPKSYSSPTIWTFPVMMSALLTVKNTLAKSKISFPAFSWYWLIVFSHY